ncbi:hypothetical protein LPAF129_11300 [Ligilactobacillus pabuli]|uniref:Uncharacterized protein n=1 Tax=Ligilactobacillus pabuli TaxID=2886039 RepID=A0ABQ5JH89_9LACO|nr:DUF6506 family protein [Ligilactobacillus pabuli]GKS81444.1 hypothetical protein LPAF129_11300 [Ligilactobacillus pabuli]
MAQLQAGFIFLAPGADYQTDHQVVETPGVALNVYGAKDYADAVLAAKEMEKQGVKSLELCGGFGIIGTAKIKEAVSADVVVGVVRFDNHPGLEYQSGDDLF